MKARLVFLGIASVVLALAASAAAVAGWQSSTSGTQTLTTASFTPSAAPVPEVIGVTGATVDLRWAASALTGGQQPTSYTVTRYTTAGTAVGTTSCAPASGVVDCAIPAVPAGEWQFTEAPVYLGWTGASSARSATVTVGNVDSSPPTGSITAPAHNAVLSGTVSVEATASDTGSGVASVQFRLRPLGTATWTALGAADTSAPYATSLDTKSLRDPRYEISAVVTDGAGNSTGLTAVTVTIRPQVESVTFTHASTGIAGSLDQNDFVTIRFTQAVSAASLCSSWVDGVVNTLSSNATVFNVSTADVFTVSVASNKCSNGLAVGSINLGANYVTADASFGANRDADRSEATWTPATRELRLTFGKRAGGSFSTGVAPATLTYTPAAAITNGFATIDPAAVTSPGQQF